MWWVVHCTSCEGAAMGGLQGCIVEWEGRKKGQYHVFSVVDRAGLSLMRMSSSDANEALAWVQVPLQAQPSPWERNSPLESR